MRFLSSPSLPVLRRGLLCGAALLAGCAARAPAPPNAIEVKKISFDGNGGMLSGQADSSLRGAMEQGKNPTLAGLIKPRQRRVFLDDDTLVLDGWRLEVWYAHHGYFDAKFNGWTLDYARTEATDGLWKKPKSVRIRGDIEPGEPYVLANLDFEGLKSLGGPFIARLKEESSLKEGEVFTLSALNATVDLTRNLLLDRSYAYVQVTPEVDVYPKRDKTVDVKIHIDLGPSCTFGPLSINGLQEIREDLVRAELPLDNQEEGERAEPFSMSTLASTRRRLFGLGVFSVVNVVPELEPRPVSDIQVPPAPGESESGASTAPETGEGAPAVEPGGAGGADGEGADAAASAEPWSPGTVIPVRIDLVEGSFQQMRVGVGALVEGGRYQAHVSGDYGNVNLANRLIRLNWNNRLGYAIFPQDGLLDENGDFELPEDRGPIILSEPELVIPHFPARAWQASLGVSVEVGVEQGYRFFSPKLTPALRWRVTDRIDVELGYQLVFFDYLTDIEDLAGISNNRLGLDNSDPYLLSLLQQKLIYSSRDDVLFPRRGLYAEYELSEAGGPVGGQFNFLRLKADQRAYLPILHFFGTRAPGAVAFRLGGGGILPYGNEDKAATPIAERLYLGGSSDVRGWQTKQLGPYICDPESGADCVSSLNRTRPVVGTDDDGDPIYADIIPIGGVLSLFTSVELRVYSTSGLGFALFTDAGMSWLTYEEAVPPVIYPSAGAGLRYKLPFGAARLDVARRITELDVLNPNMFLGEPLWNVHFGLSEAF